MAFYEELETILNRAVAMLLQNQNICKLVSYYSDNVDYRYDPLSQPDITNPQDLLMKHIFPLPKTPDADTDQDCLISVCLQGGDEITTNTGFREVYIVFDVICHLDCWMIKGGYRPLAIMHEIDSMFNDQVLKDMPSVSRPYAKPFNVQQYSDRFFGFQLAYSIDVNSNIGCG